MKGVNFIKDENNQIKAVLIDMKTLTAFEQKVEDLLDGIIAGSRKDEPTVSLAEMKKRLRKKGKL